ncbi:MAG: glycosyltransferase, partial [Myxococcota bacterium]
MPTIDCVVLNFRTAELSLQAAGAARAALARYPGSRIHIVDNDSQDGSLERLKAAVAEAAWEDVRVSSSGRNGGYGAGNNFAIRQALKDPNPPDYIYILNPDATPAEDAVAALVDQLERTPDA